MHHDGHQTLSQEAEKRAQGFYTLALTTSTPAILLAGS